MNRATNKIKIGQYEVEIITNLTWGEKEDLQAEMLKGAKVDGTGLQSFDAGVLREMKYRLMELAIKSIAIDGKEEIAFTRDWVDNLTVEEGDLLVENLDSLNKKKA